VIAREEIWGLSRSPTWKAREIRKKEPPEKSKNK
jgi:hypothetical protein